MTCADGSRFALDPPYKTISREQGGFVEGEALAAGGFGGGAPASALFGKFEGA